MKPLHISQTAWYALQATLQLAMVYPTPHIPCGRLAQAGRMPERFLLQILRTLVVRGILRSIRGSDGGYALAKPPAEISLLEILEAVEGPVASHHHLTPRQNDAPQLLLWEMCDEIVDHARQRLAEVKMSQFVAQCSTTGAAGSRGMPNSLGTPNI